MVPPQVLVALWGDVVGVWVTFYCLCARSLVRPNREALQENKACQENWTENLLTKTARKLRQAP
jgi:hypothetical protein